MPRIVTDRVLPGLWVAWAENDYGDRSHKRLGFTWNHANARTCRAIIRDEAPR